MSSKCHCGSLFRFTNKETTKQDPGIDTHYPDIIGIVIALTESRLLFIIIVRLVQAIKQRAP